MAREAFSSEEVAALLNSAFVPIKVDREERPDVDDVYMTSAHVMGERGGWPLSVWLTPEREPFASGTYFPVDAFRSQLESIAAAWSSRAEDVRGQARRVAAAVTSQMAAARKSGELSDEALAGAVTKLAVGYDSARGGWGLPKFPSETTILYLLDRFQRDGDQQALRMALATLDAMQAGGIHDQVGGGFARYATDAHWLVPHFEKMLYNQAWLGRCYLEAYGLTRDARYRRAAEGILSYVARDMSTPDGAFYSAEDADSEGEEGLFYLWTPAEIASALGPDDAPLAMEWFGVTAAGNFRERPGASILTARQESAGFAASHSVKEAALLQRIDAWRAKLLALRAKRVRPHRDEKILADWNGMMIGTFAQASVVLGDPKWRAAAERAASFALGSLRDRDGRVQHLPSRSATSNPGFLDDHAALIDGLIELHAATGATRWLVEAEGMFSAMREQFRDPADGAFTRSGPLHQRLLARPKDGYDGALPSGNALVAWDAVRLWRLTGRTQYRDDAEGVLRAFAPELRSARGAPFMLRALECLRHGEQGRVAHSATGALAVAAAGSVAPVVAGRSFAAMIDVIASPRWHVMAGPPAAPDLRATTLSVGAPFAMRSVQYPPGKSVRLPFAQAPVRLYEGLVSIPISIQVPVTTPAGFMIVRISVLTQACDDSRCLAAETLTVELPITVR
jgi:uncharacterized protein YyaL (SSP411 family)